MERMLWRSRLYLHEDLVEGEQESVKWLGEVIFWADIRQEGVDLATGRNNMFILNTEQRKHVRTCSLKELDL